MQSVLIQEANNSFITIYSDSEAITRIYKALSEIIKLRTDVNNRLQ